MAAMPSTAVDDWRRDRVTEIASSEGMDTGLHTEVSTSTKKKKKKNRKKGGASATAAAGTKSSDTVDGFDQMIDHGDAGIAENYFPSDMVNLDGEPISTSKKSRKKKKKRGANANTGGQPLHEDYSSARAGTDGGLLKKRLWNTSSDEERARIRDFWLSLAESERRSLVRIEKEAVLQKMKEQQRHSCSCSVCGRKRSAIEEELEVLYDAYYDELEQFARLQQLLGANSRKIRELESDIVMGPAAGALHGLSSPARLTETLHEGNSMAKNGVRSAPADEDDEDEEDEEKEDDEEDEEEDEDDGEDIPNIRPLPVRDEDPDMPDFFNFGNSLTVEGGLLTVADDLLVDDGRKFIEMMEHLAERRMQKEEEAAMNALGFDGDVYDSEEDSAEFDDEDEEEEEDLLTDEQRMREGRRMFQIFAARMFEQRVLQAYKERVAQERQQQLIAELDEESKRDEEKALKKARELERKRDRKRQQKLAKEEAAAKKEAERLAAEAEQRAKEEAKAAEQKKRKEEQRLKREAELRAKEQERLRKEEERKKRLAEERAREQEKERKRKEQQDRERAREQELERERERRLQREKKPSISEEQGKAFIAIPGATAAAPREEPRKSPGVQVGSVPKSPSRPNSVLSSQALHTGSTSVTPGTSPKALYGRGVAMAPIAPSVTRSRAQNIVGKDNSAPGNVQGDGKEDYTRPGASSPAQKPYTIQHQHDSARMHLDAMPLHRDTVNSATQAMEGMSLSGPSIGGTPIPTGPKGASAKSRSFPRKPSTEEVQDSRTGSPGFAPVSHQYINGSGSGYNQAYSAFEGLNSSSSSLHQALVNNHLSTTAATTPPPPPPSVEMTKHATSLGGIGAATSSQSQFSGFDMPSVPSVPSVPIMGQQRSRYSSFSQDHPRAPVGPMGPPGRPTPPLGQAQSLAAAATTPAPSQPQQQQQQSHLSDFLRPMPLGDDTWGTSSMPGPGEVYGMADHDNHVSALSPTNRIGLPPDPLMAPASRPIQRPTPIKRPSAPQSNVKRGDVFAHSEIMGSRALIDDDDEVEVASLGRRTGSRSEISPNGGTAIPSGPGVAWLKPAGGAPMPSPPATAGGAIGLGGNIWSMNRMEASTPLGGPPPSSHHEPGHGASSMFPAPIGSSPAISLLDRSRPSVSNGSKQPWNPAGVVKVDRADYV